MTISIETNHHLTPIEKAITIEPSSRRIKVYQFPNETKIKALKQLGHKERCDKLIFYVRQEEKARIKKNEGMYQEGFIRGFFKGHDAYIYSMFLDPTRNDSHAPEAEQKILKIAEADQNRMVASSLPKGYRMRKASENDAAQMAGLYDTVFQTYPTQMNDPYFIMQMMNQDVYFTVVEYREQIVSASSADFMPEFNAAEMTDCATLAGHRNQRLLSHQFSYLIKQMRSKGVQTLFCYARSMSIGMNLISVRHGFNYGGRMVQNSNIDGRLECMNIWYKNLM